MLIQESSVHVKSINLTNLINPINPINPIKKKKNKKKKKEKYGQAAERLHFNLYHSHKNDSMRPNHFLLMEDELNGSNLKFQISN